MTIEELRRRLEEVENGRRSIHTAAGDNPLDDDQQARWEQLDTDEAELREQLRTAEENEARRQRVAESRARWGSVQVDVRGNARPGDVRHMARQQRVDAVLRAVDGRIESGEEQRHFERLVKRHAADGDWAAQLVARATPEYESGWAKLMVGRAELLTTEERAAIAVGTNTQGGYLVPTHLDPTLILTNAGSNNVMRQLARPVTLTGGANTWHGVTTAGVTASWDAELTEVSDDTPSVGTASIPTNSAKSLVAASIEAFEDIANLATDVLMMFGDARDRLEGAAFVTGSGSGQPKGVVTALAASSGVCVVSTTAAAIGEVDVHGLYKAVPQRWRGRGAWLMNPTYNLAIKRLGTAVSSSYSGDLTMPVTDRILGRPVYESDDMPSTQTTTQLDSEIVYGDFSNYVIVDKPGSTSVEFIPHLFNTANNLPDGRRAWYMHFRTGGDVVNLAALRLLQDKTSA